MAETMELRNIGQIRNAEIVFGDLTVFVGPQASGKSIALQWLKLLSDTGHIQKQLSDYGLDWSRRLPDFFDIYFGEGMHSLWRPGESEVSFGGRHIDVDQIARRRARIKPERVFLIPAQRVLAMRDGWPRPFGDYSAGDPYSVRAFSERLRFLMETEFIAGQKLEPRETIFPKANRLQAAFRSLLQQTIFGDFMLQVDRDRSQKRLVLAREANSGALPYMVWSAGQREFVPLLLSLYWLLPPSRVPRRQSFEWVIIEEPEAGLHPKAISTVLLIILELLYRDYRVCVSTHSQQVVDLVWALQLLQKSRATANSLLDVFGMQHRTAASRSMASSALLKAARVYYFDPVADHVRDITGLDPGSPEAAEANWGGLLEFSGRTNEVVARAIAATEHDAPPEMGS